MKAGPGPQTLAFRLATSLVRHSSTQHAVRSPSSPLYRNTRTTKSKPHAPRHTTYRDTSSQPSSESIPTKIHTSTTFEARKHGRSQGDIFTSRPVEPIHALPLIPSSNDVIYLPAPRLHDPTLSPRLRKACKQLNLREASKLYQALYDQVAPTDIDVLDLEDLEAVSSLLSRTMTGAEGHHLGRTALQDPELFGWLGTMAITAAARDKWDGLYYLMLATLAVGRPGDTIKLHERFKDTLRTMQGRKREDLTSWDRKARLEARVQGEGLTPLGAINIAAHTLLDSFQPHVMLDMLDSQFDAHNIAWSVRDDISDVLDRLSTVGKSNAGSQFEKYQQAVEDIQFAVLCYHPNAFIDRIKGHARSKEWKKFMDIWDKLLRASKGEGAFIRARDLHEYGSRMMTYHEIPISPEIWDAFIYCFRWQGNALEILRIVDVYLPERGLEPSARILSGAIRNLALLSNPEVNASPESQKLAKEEIFRMWSMAKSRGIDTSDELLGARFVALDVMRRTKDLRVMLSQLRQGHLPMGPHTMRAVLGFSVKTRDLEAAEKLLLKGPDYDRAKWNETLISHNRGYLYKIFLTHLLSTPGLSIDTKRKALARVNSQYFNHATPPIISWQTKGLLLCFAIDTARTMDDPLPYVAKVKNQIFAEVRSQPVKSYQYFSDIMTAVLKRYDVKFRPKDLEFSIAAEILEETAEMRDDLTRKRAQVFWTTFFTEVAQSDLDNETRSGYIDRAMLSLEAVDGQVPLSVRHNLIESLLSREDGKGRAEALKRWDELKTDFPSANSRGWSEVVYSCIRSGSRDVAEVIVQDAWEKEEVPYTDEFWRTVLNHGLYVKAEIGREELMAAMRSGRRDDIVGVTEGAGSHDGKLDMDGMSINDEEDILERSTKEELGELEVIM